MGNQSNSVVQSDLLDQIMLQKLLWL